MTLTSAFLSRFISLGNEPTTSAKPPILTKGDTSALTCKTLIILFPPSLF